MNIFNQGCMKCPLLELLYSPLKISFEDFSGFFCSFFFVFFLFHDLFHDVIDPSAVQLSFQGKHKICPENGTDLFTLYGSFTQGAEDLP